MPVIKLRLQEVLRLLGGGVGAEELVERMPMLGCEVEGVEGEHVYVEYFPNRPDLYSAEGVARAYRAFFGIEPGLREYSASPPAVQMRVEESVQKVRPFIACCEVLDAELDETLVGELMEFQEKLHWALGRDRTRASIGLHDMQEVKPPLRYAALAGDELSFVPLGESRELTLAEVLREHPKGREYAHILAGSERLPVVLDAEQRVLSLPPIINSELTRVTEESSHLLIEVTGTDRRAVRYALNVLATAMAERGFRLRSVEVVYPQGVQLTPELEPEELELGMEYVRRMLGFELGEGEVVECLRRMGYDASVSEGRLKVRVPCYRCDVMHVIDVVEDIAIGYGYERIEEAELHIPQAGYELEMEALEQRLRALMPGYGFTEVLNLMLSNEEENFKSMRRSGRAVRLENPISEEHTIVRTSLLPKLLGTLRQNKHCELPQRIFEAGDVLQLSDGRAVRRRMVALAVI
ncbi:MAG: phenylalanine--tRNA ligase subunit beta, partial [Euryarchaeota archaeon]|nr:phenylalanine--tRNA ligase subunit beta [Euryarchaeota archaeon]